jgi:hypothetical protein
MTMALASAYNPRINQETLHAPGGESPIRNLGNSQFLPPRNPSGLAPTICPAQLPRVIIATRHKVNNLKLGHLSHYRVLLQTALSL